jgi:CheY-like chemotaxis protein
MKQQGSNGHLGKVLVVDDDDQLADVVREVLRDAGYSVATVRHGAAALELIEHVAPDLILLDLSMPIMDGWSFVSQYRRSARAGARIVLLTANPHASEIAGTLRADGYIQKPFDIAQLVDVIARELTLS